MLAPHHDFDPATDEGALAAAIKAAPHDDTPKLVMADWQDDHGSPVVAAMYRHAVYGSRTDPDKVTSPPVIGHVTPSDGIAVSRHAGVLSGLLPTRHWEVPHYVNSAVTSARTATPRGSADNAGAAKDHHVLSIYHSPHVGAQQGIVAANAHRYAAAVHNRLAEQA